MPGISAAVARFNCVHVPVRVDGSRWWTTSEGYDVRSEYRMVLAIAPLPAIPICTSIGIDRPGTMTASERMSYGNPELTAAVTPPNRYLRAPMDTCALGTTELPVSTTTPLPGAASGSRNGHPGTDLVSVDEDHGMVGLDVSPRTADDLSVT